MSQRNASILGLNVSKNWLEEFRGRFLRNGSVSEEQHRETFRWFWWSVVSTLLLKKKILDYLWNCVDQVFMWLCGVCMCEWMMQCSFLSVKEKGGKKYFYANCICTPECQEEHLHATCSHIKKGRDFLCHVLSLIWPDSKSLLVQAV